MKASQHSFRKKSSCLTNFLLLFSKIYEALDNDKDYIMYLDSNKTLHKVPHKREIKKVEVRSD